MSMPPFAMYLECKMNKFMNQLIHDFMYKNVAKYSWHILNIVKKQEDNLYYCTFDILASYNQESFGQCSITLVNTETSVDCLTVSFKAYKESVYGTGNVYPKVTLPLSRYEVTDDVLGRYFYRLIHNLYALAVFYQEKKRKYF